MRSAIRDGDDDTLAQALSRVEYWMDDEKLRYGDNRRVNIHQASSRLARMEFDTWYVRGFARRLMDDGERTCKVVQGGDADWDPECKTHDGLLTSPKRIYHGHRARYWPKVDGSAFSIPSSPGCSHTIERVIS
jgi:hypothetical protein